MTLARRRRGRSQTFTYCPKLWQLTQPLLLAGLGKPNSDGTIGKCTACNTRHTSSAEVARQPNTCGQCHVGPDHSQIEIHEELRHRILERRTEEALDRRTTT